jgi:cell division ATPase FtsA
VSIGERRSDICLVRDGAEITRQAIPIGCAHFVNDVAWCLRIEREHAAELVRRHGIPSREERRGTLVLVAGRNRAAVNTKGSNVRVSRKLYNETIEARAVEFAGFIRDCIRAAGPGEAFRGAADSGRGRGGDGQACRAGRASRRVGSQDSRGLRPTAVKYSVALSRALNQEARTVKSGEASPYC